MNALETSGQKMQVAIAKAQRFERLDRVEQVGAVGSGLSVPLTQVMQLGRKIQSASVLRVTAVDHVAHGPNLSLWIAP
jgi:hypothetical protein